MNAPQAAAEQVAQFAATIRYEDLPSHVAEQIEWRILDFIGVSTAAMRLETSRAAHRWVLAQGGVERATAIGIARPLPAGLAAFANGVLAHSLDFDDTHMPSVVHPSASVIPAAIAAAESNGASGKELILGIAIGLEVCVRLGMAGYDEAARASTYFEHGQHATSICGAMGAAVAAAMMGGSEADVLNSLGLAASMASGILEANRTGGTVKRMHCGWAAHAGVSAAELVAQGFTGPPTVLEGRFGFLQAWLHGHSDESAIARGLGDEWEQLGISVKPYPANHFTHAALDAAAALRARGLTPDRIESITLGVPRSVVRTIGEPIESKRAPATGYMAQFSGPYAVALGLLGGGGLGAGLDDYSDELVTEQRRLAIMQKVSVVEDPRCTELFPRQFPAVLSATLHDGTVVTEEMMTTRGTKERPLSPEEITMKYRSNVVPIVGEDVAAEVERLCGQLQHSSNVGELLRPLTTIGVD